MKALNDYQYSWTRTKVIISWWPEALLLFMTEKLVGGICCCSWLRRGAASIRRGQQCSHRRLCRHSLSIWCSTLVQADLSLAASSLMLSTFFLQWASLWPLSSFPIFSVQCSKPRMGEPIFPPGICMINVWTCKLYDELALRRVTYGRNSCMMKQESWFLPKLYNENFLSDGHWVTQKSWVQDASRRVCPDAKQCIRSTHPKGRF